MVLHKTKDSRHELRNLGGDSLREFAIGITSFRFVLYNVIPGRSISVVRPFRVVHEAKASHYINLAQNDRQMSSNNIQLLKFKQTQISRQKP